jgi:hypothetical protein
VKSFGQAQNYGTVVQNKYSNEDEKENIKSSSDLNKWTSIQVRKFIARLTDDKTAES